MALDPLTVGLTLGSKALGILDQWVEDKDLRATLAFELTKINNEFLSNVYASEAVPGYVKFLHAVRDLIIPMFRPIGGLALTGFAVYATTKGIELPGWLTAVLAASFPGWMVGRQVEKKRDGKAVRKAQARSERQPDPVYEDAGG